MEFCKKMSVSTSVLLRLEDGFPQIGIYPCLVPFPLGFVCFEHIRIDPDVDFRFPGPVPFRMPEIRRPQIPEFLFCQRRILRIFHICGIVDPFLGFFRQWCPSDFIQCQECSEGRQCSEERQGHALLSIAALPDIASTGYRKKSLRHLLLIAAGWKFKTFVQAIPSSL